ncbi:hypothetical protein SDC9_04132 [bioreactor metagenome]|uniref:IraD/Gp25-like domain-containing protein n=1 Tax=bioreactor metagenome TaxID=1076179 RepID=A0A644SV72_9ZZZZ|nr:GPW/gp25 family protein [Negativicutes bacterium]
MEYVITLNQTTGVNFSPTVIEEIIQNVRIILSTPKFSVPLNREFGVTATMLDEPIPVAQAKLTSEIITAVQRWEPRVKVTKVTYEGDGIDGKLIPKVRVKIIEST